MDPVLRALLRWPDRLYRHRLGWLLGRRFLRLGHTGRRSGRLHTTVLEVVADHPRSAEFVVVSGFGERADWLRNLDAGGPAEITVGRTRSPSSIAGWAATKRSPCSPSTNGATG